MLALCWDDIEDFDVAAFRTLIKVYRELGQHHRNTISKGVK